jgi:ABC-2 type transport system ATP-binding protein
VVTLEGITKTYAGKPAVEDLSLIVPRGSIFGLIGPNGAGKTTTLKMVATLIKPDRGTIRVNGHDLGEDVKRARAIMGYMPDSFGSFGGLTCEEYLTFFGRIHGWRASTLEKRIESVLDLTDLGGMREQLASALSTGMRQRLSLAKTLLHDPDVLILDEPASGLDPRARIEIRSLLDELGKMGKTVLISSHILADLQEICTAVAIIEVGRVVWSGSLEEGRSALESRRATVEVAEEDAPRALEAIRKLAPVESAEASRGRIDVKLKGAAGNEILAALLEAGVEVQAWSVDRKDLEDIFLERTRGIVS